MRVVNFLPIHKVNEMSKYMDKKHRTKLYFTVLFICAFSVAFFFIYSNKKPLSEQGGGWYFDGVRVPEVIYDEPQFTSFNKDSLLDIDPTIWLSLNPVQCGGNPWEKEWEKNNPSAQEFPFYKEEEFVKAYFMGRGIQVKSIILQSFPPGAGNCDACECARGDTLYIEAPVKYKKRLIADYRFKESDKPAPLKEFGDIISIALRTKGGDEDEQKDEVTVDFATSIITLTRSNEGTYLGKLDEEKIVILNNLLNHLDVSTLKTYYNYPISCLGDAYSKGAPKYTFIFGYALTGHGVYAEYCIPEEMQPLFNEMRTLQTCLVNTKRSYPIPCGISNVTFTYSDPSRECLEYSDIGNRDICYTNLAKTSKRKTWCDKVEVSKNNCYSEVAVATLNEDICGLITLQYPPRDPYEGIRLCFKAVALAKLDESICELIADTTLEASCINEIKLKKDGIHVPD